MKYLAIDIDCAVHNASSCASDAEGFDDGLGSRLLGDDLNFGGALGVCDDYAARCGFGQKVGNDRARGVGRGRQT